MCFVPTHGKHRYSSTPHSSFGEIRSKLISILALKGKILLLCFFFFLSGLYVYTARLVSDLVENPKDSFSHEAARFGTAGRTDRQRERERKSERERERRHKLIIDDRSNHFYSLSFKSEICRLIAPVPVHCFSITFILLFVICCLFLYLLKNVYYRYLLEPPFQVRTIYVLRKIPKLIYEKHYFTAIQRAVFSISVLT